MNDFIDGLNDVFKYAVPKTEVLPKKYILVKSGALVNRPDRQVSVHKTLGDAWLKNRDNGFLYHLYAVYPDKSMKHVSLTGGETDFYNTALNDGGAEHTSDDNRWLMGTNNPHNADVARNSMHRILQRHIAALSYSGLQNSDVKQNNIDTGPTSTAQGLVRKALDEGELTPLLVLADHLEENGLSYTPKKLREGVDKCKQEIDDKRNRGLLRENQ